MMYIENIFICISIPLLLSLIFIQETPAAAAASRQAASTSAKPLPCKNFRICSIVCYSHPCLCTVCSGGSVRWLADVYT